MILLHNPYNSKKFGITMSDVNELTGSEREEDVRALLLQGVDDSDHVSVKIPTDFKCCLNSFLRCGFRLVDTQVELSRDLQQIPMPTIPKGYCVRSLEPNDVLPVKAIARESFRIDRWHSDKSLPDEACDEYYAEWVDSCVSGYAQEVLVATCDNVAAAFMTLRSVEDLQGRIDLTAVERTHRGRGVYRSLVQSALNWAFEQGLSGMLATTQINNLGSQRTWIDEGFNCKSSCYVLHYSYVYDGGCK